MLTWIMSNLATIIISLALVAVVTLILLNMRKNKKKCKSSCGASCACCPMASSCENVKCNKGATALKKIS